MTCYNKLNHSQLAGCSSTSGSNRRSEGTSMSPYYHKHTHHISVTKNKLILITPRWLQPKRAAHSQVVRCSPSLIRSFMRTALTPSMRTTIQNMGFGGILQLAAKSLDNQEFMSWLMDKFDPENMRLEMGEGKQISVTDHFVKCIFESPSKGRDPPMLTDDTGKKILMNVIAQLLPDEPSPKDVKVNPTRAT
jgi:hypothetical protein